MASLVTFSERSNTVSGNGRCPQGSEPVGRTIVSPPPMPGDTLILLMKQYISSAESVKTFHSSVRSPGLGGGKEKPFQAGVHQSFDGGKLR